MQKKHEARHFLVLRKRWQNSGDNQKGDENVARKKYQLYDFYECYGVVAECDTLKEIYKAWDNWVANTDGECDLIIRQWDENLQGYRPVPVR